MQITVFGANGKVGQLVVERLLADGHSVVAFVHQQSAFEPSEQLKIIKSDVHNAAFVEAALRGSGAVVSALGSWHTPTKDILSSAMNNIIPAMQKQGVRRIVSLTGSAAWAPGDNITFSNKMQHRLFSLGAKAILRDAEKHLEALHASKLDWTVLRSPVMRDKPDPGYELNGDLPGIFETIPRESVARALVDQLTDARFLQLAPHIHTTRPETA
jgi:putative NADH-flavin reductase